MSIMLGRNHGSYTELGGGGGWLVGRDAGFVTLGARVGYVIGG